MKCKLSKYEKYLLVNTLGSEFRKNYYKEQKLQRRLYLLKNKGTAYLNNLEEKTVIIFSPMFYNKYFEIFSNLDSSKYSHGKNKQQDLLPMKNEICKLDSLNLSEINKLFDDRALKSLHSQINKNYLGFQTFLDVLKEENSSNIYTNILVTKYPFLRANI